MKNVEKHLVGWLSVCLLLCSFPVWAQGDAGDYLTIVGMVKDKQNKKALENVNVSVHGSNIGTVTNAEGEFALKIKKTEALRELEISHIGYVNNHISLEKTHEFYKKYGGKTIILARFVPIVRTFAPFVAGMGKMNYYYFMMYNLVGGALWVAVFCYAGYFFGDLPFVQENLKLLIVAIIFISVLPAIIEVVRAKLKS